MERLAELLLAGYEDLDPAFHIWLMARRQGLHDRLIRGLEDGYRDHALDPRRRRRMAQATLLLDPTHEEACRIVMRCAAEAGETGAAIRAYDELYRLLDEDYDMEPSAATLTQARRAVIAFARRRQRWGRLRRLTEAARVASASRSRTATVTARGEVLLYALEKAPFVTAVTGHAPSAQAAGALVAERRDELARLA